MCIGCYREYGEPVDITEQTATVVQLIRDVYEENPVGGNLHIILDDWNLEDHWVPDMLAKNNLTLAERACMMMMGEMTEDQRATALAIHDGFIKEIPDAR